MELNLTQWVSETEDYVDIRRAMHIVLTAVSSSSRLSSIMALKGGVLMAIQYANTRFTTDLDFSALSNPQEVDIEALRSELNNSLLAAEVELNTYNLACRVQKIKKQPKDFETVDFPSLLITIGYAKKDNVGAMKRLEKGESPHTISIDYSFNEVTGELDEVHLENEEVVKVYSFTALMAEKFRSILQQVVRNRSRRQDVYDLHHLITNFAKNTEGEKVQIYNSLIEKSANKKIDEYLRQSALRDPEIRTRSEEGFEDLEHEDVTEVSFEEAYSLVQEYFESLPWENS
ncbi:nucleotidyl transferase AbiEii/AbiGii toxin family protein [Acinetobacter baumannii]|uniref:nucleotidyl transferase AbiEii/AbiGii toxin family protein n=1 Tax=Acinetobacter baumannii TaxID=470 RepID=UPI00387916F4